MHREAEHGDLTSIRARVASADAPFERRGGQTDRERPHGASWRAGGVTPSAATTPRMASARHASAATKPESRRMAGRPTSSPSPPRRGSSMERLISASRRPSAAGEASRASRRTVSRSDESGDAADVEGGEQRAGHGEEGDSGERHAREAPRGEHGIRPGIGRLGGRRGPQQHRQRHEAARPTGRQLPRAGGRRRSRAPCRSRRPQRGRRRHRDQRGGAQQHPFAARGTPVARAGRATAGGAGETRRAHQEPKRTSHTWPACVSTTDARDRPEIEGRPRGPSEDAPSGTESTASPRRGRRRPRPGWRRAAPLPAPCRRAVGRSRHPRSITAPPTRKIELARWIQRATRVRAASTG
jgi:hypothetical protein